MLFVKNLRVAIDNKEILKGIDLKIKSGEIHVLMGPNGAGKTTLAMALMGHSNFNPPAGGPISNLAWRQTGFQFQIDGNDLTNLKPDERARKGLFVAFQQPIEVEGISLISFLRTAYKALHPDEKVKLLEFKEKVKKALKSVLLPESFMERSLNEGFSGGERKRAEVAQLLVLNPKFAILDEVDSGLDTDSLRVAARAIREASGKYNIGILLITHYPKILHYLKPNKAHILIDGKIKKSDGIALVKKIEKEGYAAI